jgi:hypothetical protein
LDRPSFGQATPTATEKGRRAGRLPDAHGPRAAFGTWQWQWQRQHADRKGWASPLGAAISWFIFTAHPFRATASLRTLFFPRNFSFFKTN